MIQPSSKQHQLRSLNKRFRRDVTHPCMRSVLVSFHDQEREWEERVNNRLTAVTGWLGSCQTTSLCYVSFPAAQESKVQLDKVNNFNK